MEHLIVELILPDRILGLMVRTLRRVNEWKIGWQIIFKMVNAFGYFATNLLMKVISLSILSN